MTFTPTSVLLVGLLLIPTQVPNPPYAATRGFQAAIDFLGSVRDVFLKTVVDPAAREQARRSLRRLSERLEALSKAKEELALDIVATSAISQHKLNQLLARTREVRESLSDAFKPLPDDWRDRANKVQLGLETQLHEKSNTLVQMKRQLGLPEGAPLEELKRESQSTVALVAEMRKLVDRLIQELTRPAPSPVAQSKMHAHL
jgi:hypothetical protein